jgi:hypothetical protein
VRDACVAEMMTSQELRLSRNLCRQLKADLMHLGEVVSQQLLDAALLFRLLFEHVEMLQ